MSKRKCVRKAIIELTDSDDEGEADDCIIVKSDHVTSTSDDYKVSNDCNGVTNSDKQRPRRKATVKKGESQEKSVKNKVTKKPRTVKSSSIGNNKTNEIKPNRKRKKSENDDKMGLGSSKTGIPCKQYKSESQIRANENNLRCQWEEEEWKRAQRLGQHFNAQKQHEEEQRLKVQRHCQNQQLRHQSVSPPVRATSPRTLYPTLPQASMTQQRVAPEAKPKPEDTAETYLARLRASNVHCIEWTVVDFVCEENSVSRYVAENLVKLLEDDNTIPFIARYRKDMTQGMDADDLRKAKNSYDKAKLIKQKAATIIKEIDKQGKWTAEFHAFVQGTKSLNDLEQIHSMFKVTKSTLVENAKAVGLGPPAEAVIKAQMIHSLSRLVKPNVAGLRDEEQVKSGIVCIIADMINKDQRTFDVVKELRNRFPMRIDTTKVKGAEKEAAEESRTNNKKKQEDENSKYDLYHNFSCLEPNMKPHQILAINRGEARKILSVKVNIPSEFDAAFKEHCFRQYRTAVSASPTHRMLMTTAIDYALNKTVKKTVKRRTRQEMNERAEIAAIDVFSQNVKQLLLTPPVRGKVVVGVDPGFRHGCKLAVVSEQGDMLETDTIYPHDHDNRNARYNAERVLVRLVQKHRCTIFALGNGTACRETEIFLAELIKKKVFAPIDVVYTIVDETGASIYSCSDEASTEFPNIDINVVSAVSIARRLQDPMAELVKIEPKHLGVGMYQHDLPEKQLASKLNEVIMEAVSFVGVDINTASVSLLKRVAGLGESKANRIIEWRKSSGPFTNRNDLLKVKGIGSKTFEQCAGFIRIMPETAINNERQRASLNALDQTWIHPESYDVAKSFLNAAKCNLLDLGTRAFIFAVSLFAAQGYTSLAKKFGTTIETIDVIVKGLSMEKGQDIRAKGDAKMFRKSLTSLDDLVIGTTLTGVVRNITHFGAFVDVGVERSGLIHKNYMGGMTISVGQRVETKVNNIEKERGRLGLTLIKCF